MADKDWARKAILDPLTAPEPSEETGPGSSHYNQLRGSLPSRPAANSAASAPRSSSGNPKGKAPEDLHISGSGKRRGTGSSYPTPPASASPTGGSFHSSNPYSASSPKSNPSILVDVGEKSPPPYSPPSKGSSLGGPSKSQPHRRYNSTASRPSQGRHALSPEKEPQRNRSSSTSNVPGHARSSSLNQRFPGDLSHRPLDQIKRETRAADRMSRRHRRGASNDTDVIDALDTIGGPYHHGGPYDATLASRNTNKLYSPVAAVQESNMMALQATPAEYIKDSLDRHMPLQGTATVPSGSPDMSGKIMEYEEGADLMREPDAPGGAYKRWDGIQYHPDDLKGKGEPSYTVEKDLKNRKHAVRGSGVDGYEMQSGANSSLLGRQRSASHGATDASSSRLGVYQDDDGLQRSNTTGRGKISDGLKRRFGSLRKKKSAAEVY